MFCRITGRYRFPTIIQVVAATWVVLLKLFCFLDLILWCVLRQIILCSIRLSGFGFHDVFCRSFELWLIPWFDCQIFTFFSLLFFALLIRTISVIFLWTSWFRDLFPNYNFCSLILFMFSTCALKFVFEFGCEFVPYKLMHLCKLIMRQGSMPSLLAILSNPLHYVCLVCSRLLFGTAGLCNTTIFCNILFSALYVKVLALLAHSSISYQIPGGNSPGRYSFCLPIYLMKKVIIVGTLQVLLDPLAVTKSAWAKFISFKKVVCDIFLVCWVLS